MKHQQFPFGHGLPDAPMAMPKQVLERDRTLLDLLVQALFPWQRR